MPCKQQSIAISLVDHTLGKAFDSQRNNKDIFRKDLRGMQSAKEMLSSDQANFHMNPWDSSTFEQLSVPIPNDIPASTMSSFLSQLTVVPTSSSSHFHVRTNATSTATGLTSLNDVTIAHFSTTTAIMTATTTQVSATRTATMNAPKYQLDECEATQTQHKTRSPSILHPAKKAADYATQRNPLLYFVPNDPAITLSGILLPHDFECPAITTTKNANFSLQLIVELFHRNQTSRSSQFQASSDCCVHSKGFNCPNHC